jgi:hypothetical protein
MFAEPHGSTSHAGGDRVASHSVSPSLEEPSADDDADGVQLRKTPVAAHAGQVPPAGDVASATSARARSAVGVTHFNVTWPEASVSTAEPPPPAAA